MSAHSVSNASSVLSAGRNSKRISPPFVAHYPELVGDTRGRDHPAPRPTHLLLAAHQESKGAWHHLESLLLERVDVLYGQGDLGRVGEGYLRQLPVRLGRDPVFGSPITSPALATVPSFAPGRASTAGTAQPAPGLSARSQYGTDVSSSTRFPNSSSPRMSTSSLAATGLSRPEASR